VPELAEVEFFRRRWAAGHRGRVRSVRVHPRARVFREADPARIAHALMGARLAGSEAAAKQMLFRFTGGAIGRGRSGWLGVHLGMSGELLVAPADQAPARHDHLVLVQDRRALVFRDPRMFGRIRFDVGAKPPQWWTAIAPAILSDHFTVEAVGDFLRRHARSPIKAVLLRQERFPGIGNWMADEVLWRAALHPARRSGSLRPAEVRALHRECRWVCREALARNGGRGRPLPPDLNVNLPRSWLFWHRWEDGGTCPRSGRPLARAEIGGRTTCWSPARQRLR